MIRNTFIGRFIIGIDFNNHSKSQRLLKMSYEMPRFTKNVYFLINELSDSKMHCICVWNSQDKKQTNINSPLIQVEGSSARHTIQKLFYLLTIQLGWKVKVKPFKHHTARKFNVVLIIGCGKTRDTAQNEAENSIKTFSTWLDICI